MAETFTRILKEKEYELSDHLGNVRVTFSDVKQLVGAPNAPPYRVDLQTYANYYPFGMLQPQRSYPDPGAPAPGPGAGSSHYRYGYNGKEMDNEWYGDAGNGLSGVGNSYDYGFRIYNPRYTRFLSVDPLTASYPMLTPYQFAGDSPILFIDLDGLEPLVHRMSDEQRWELVIQKTLEGLWFVSSEVAKCTDINDVMVVATGLEGHPTHVTFEEGDGVDVATAAGGLVVPIASGHLLKKVGEAIFSSSKSADEVIEHSVPAVVRGSDEIATRPTIVKQDAPNSFGKNVNAIRAEARAVFDKKYGKAARQGKDVHHIIPCELRDHKLIQRAAQDGGGYDINEVGNLTAVTAIRNGGTHGNHPAYNASIRKKLNDVFDGNPDISPADAAAEVRRIQGEVQNTIDVLSTTKINDLFKIPDSGSPSMGAQQPVPPID